MIAYWCTFIIASMISWGPQASPTRQPVMANALENPWRKMVRSRMPGSEAIETWVPS